MSLQSSAPQAPHFFTVDVEDYFQVGAFEHLISRDTWDQQPCRVERNVDLLLGLLAEAGATGTFFTLGWIAQRYPKLIRRIALEGHEIASHGFTHRRVNELSAVAFRREIHDSKAVLEDASATEVIGFRAPNFSILPGCEWAFDVLVEEGYRYDSSRFPIRRAGYGSPDTPQYAHVIRCNAGELIELPLTTYNAFGMRIPAAGGAYLRHFPYALVRQAFAERTKQRESGVFYIHPWELDPEQPRVRAPLMTRVRHYRGLKHTTPRIARLLHEFRFSAIEPWLSETGRRAAPVPLYS